MNDLEHDLRLAGEQLPGPDDTATARARRAFVAAPTTPRRHLHRGSLRLGLLAAAVLAVGAGAGYALAGSKQPRAVIRVQRSAPHVRAPGFVPQPGWYSVDTAGAAQSAPVATTANVPFSPRDFTGGNGGIPTNTLAGLPPSGIVIQVIFYPRGQVPGVDARFPPAAQPFAIGDAITTTPVEGAPMDVGYRRLLVSAGGYDADISFFFGVKTPTAALLAGAQGELDGLILPAARPRSRP